MRPRDPDPPTRNKLLDAAEEIMLSKGYVASSVDEICTAAGVTKGSFFHYFRSKEELGKVLLERFSSRQEEIFMSACAEVEDPLERVYRLIDCAIECSRAPDAKGCLVGTFAQEISETHPELRKVCECSFERFASGVAADLVAAKARYAPDADFDAESLGAYMLSMAQGSQLLFKASGGTQSGSVFAANFTHFKNYLRTLYGR